MSVRTGGEGEDVHALSGAYALDAVDDLERAAFERHLAGCETCREEVHGLRLTAARLGAAVPATPPQRLRAAVLAQVRATRQLAPYVAGARGGRRRSVLRGLPAAVSVAAVVLLALVVSLTVVLAVQQDRLGDSRDRALALERILTDPDLERTEPLAGGGGLRVVAAGDRALVTLVDAAGLPEDRDYQLWLIPESGDPVPSVVLDEGGGRAYLDDLGTSTALAVTVEPTGGSERPTTDPVAVVPLAG